MLEIALVVLIVVRLTSVQENWRGRPDAARPAADVLGSIFGSEIALNLKTYNPQNHTNRKKRWGKHRNNTKMVLK